MNLKQVANWEDLNEIKRSLLKRFSVVYSNANPKKDEFIEELDKLMSKYEDNKQYA